MGTAQKTDRTLKGSFGGLEYFGWRDFKDLLWRRKTLIVGITLLFGTLASLFAYWLPDQYRASALIMVDPGKVPESYVKSTATIDANQRLALLQEQVLSDTSLGRVIDELGLYRSMKATRTQDQIVDVMRSKIEVAGTTTGSPARTLKAFNVSFTAPNSALAAKVANRIASRFIEENLKVREQQVIGTADFFSVQLQKTKQDLDEKSKNLAQLRARYSSELPESQNLHIQALASAESALREEIDATSRAKQQRANLQLLADGPEVVDLDAASVNPGLKQELEHLEAELNQLRSHYGPSYPDVISKAADIESLKQRINKPGELGQPSSLRSNKRPNPAIAAQMSDLDEQIKKHEARQAQLESRVKFHESAIERVPAAQEQLTSALNDLAAVSDRYKRLEDRKFGADMFSDVEARQQGERFVLLDPAQPPQHPISPNRFVINAIGIGAGLTISLLLIALLELLDPAVKTEREVRGLVAAPVFGEIPMLTANHPVRRRRWWSILAASGNLLLAIAYAGALTAALTK